MGLYDNLKKKASEAIDSATKKTSDAYSGISKKIDNPLSGISEKLDGLHASGSTKFDEIKTAASAKFSATNAAVSQMSTEVLDNIKETKARVDEWAKTVPDTIQDYSSHFNAEDFWEKIKSTASKVGQDLLFMALTMYYTVADFLSKQKDADDERQ